MEILIVSQYFWPENFRINDLAAGLVERGHAVTVLTGMPNYPSGQFSPGYGLFKKTREEYKGVSILRVPLIPRGSGGGIRLALNYISFALFASILAPFICCNKYDLIFVFEPSPITVGLPALVLKRFRRIPILFWVQDLWPESLSATGAISSKVILNTVERLVHFIYRHCDRVLVQSQAFSSVIQSQGVGAERIMFFPNSVENMYVPLPDEPSRNMDALLPDGFLIMFAGNIGASQDFGTILSAAENLKDQADIHWVILGDGRRFEWVRDQVKVRGLSDTVHLLGRHPAETMTAFFAKADVMLVTLKRDPIFSLTIPSKVQSYMACEKPLIAALDGEGARLIIESGSGLAGAAEDVDTLTESIRIMYHMPREEREAMGRRGGEYCKANFGREMLIDRLDGWMRECLYDTNNAGLAG